MFDNLCYDGKYALDQVTAYNQGAFPRLCPFDAMGKGTEIVEINGSTVGSHSPIYGYGPYCIQKRVITTSNKSVPYWTGNVLVSAPYEPSEIVLAMTGAEETPEEAYKALLDAIAAARKEMKNRGKGNRSFPAVIMQIANNTGKIVVPALGVLGRGLCSLGSDLAAVIATHLKKAGKSAD